MAHRAGPPRREARRSKEGSNGQSHIVEQRHENLPSARAPEPALVNRQALGADGVDVAERLFGGVPGRDRAMSGALEVADPHRKMEIQLIVDVGPQVGPEEADVAPPAGARRSCHRYSSGR